MPSGSDMVQCPAENCDYSGLKPSVLGHYSGKKDGFHPGGYQKAKDLLDSGTESNSEPQSEPQSEQSTEPRTGTNSSPESETGENPVFGSADPTHEPESQRSGRTRSQSNMEEAGKDPVCPACGGEVYDFRHFETGKYHKLNGMSLFVQGDYQCSSCGKWWVDE